MDLGEKDSLLLFHLKLFCHLRGEILYTNSKPGSDHLALFDEITQDLFGHINGNGKSYACARLDDHGINSNHLSVDIDQRASAIARIDGGIGLNEIFISSRSQTRPAFCTDDSHGHGMLQAKGG